MDTTALRIGNLLVGNSAEAAAVEFTLGGFAVRFLVDKVFVLAGADVNANLDGVPVPAWWICHARAGQELRTGMATQGMRTMLCVSGGIDTPCVMGARATDLKGGFGGHEGRALQPGDCLPTGDTPLKPIPDRGFGLSAGRLGLLPPIGADTVIRFLPAAEWRHLSESMRDSFLAQPWKLRPDSNRMGYRFAGEPLAFERAIELHSHGILPGTIQLPPDGLPVVQMNDANTCGGYPKLGAVIAADLPRLAQIRLGDSLRFEPVDRATALAASAQVSELIEGLSHRIDLARDYAKRWGKQ